MGDIGRLKTSWRDSAPLRGNPAERSPESVAAILRNTRVLLGYNLEEVANSLNIRAAHLEALEENRFSDLPPLVYAQGFVASYAHFLELDKNELVARFREEASGAPAPLPTIQQFNLNTQPDAAERRVPSIAVVVAGFILVIFAYGLWQASVPDRRDDVLAVPPLPTRFAAEAFETLPAPAPVTQPAAVHAQPVATPVAEPITAANQAAASLQPYRGAGSISLRAHGSTWVQFHNAAGIRVGSTMLRAGQSYTVPANWGKVTMTTGNLSAFAVVVDGTAVTLESPANRARYTVALDPQRLFDGSAVLP